MHIKSDNEYKQRIALEVDVKLGYIPTTYPLVFQCSFLSLEKLKHKLHYLNKYKTFNYCFFR